MAWSSPWEDTDLPTKNIMSAACRPATFLNYIRHGNGQQPFPNGLWPTTLGGMCAQGFSAGSAAVAYSLVWYGEGADLDRVELLSGPVMTNIAQGCVEPDAASVTVCAGSPPICNLGPVGPWSVLPEYVQGDQMLSNPSREILPALSILQRLKPHTIIGKQ